MHEIEIGELYGSGDHLQGRFVVTVAKLNGNTVQVLTANTDTQLPHMHQVTVKAEDIAPIGETTTLFFSPLNIAVLDKNQLGSPMGKLSEKKTSELLKSLAFVHAENYYAAIHKPTQNIPFVPGKSRVTYAGRVFNQDEIVSLVDSSLDFWLTTGRFAEQFEKEFARFIGVKKSLLVNSGSSANLIAFSTLTSPALKDRQIKKSDEVIAVAAGFPTTINPILQYGAVPVFIDIDIVTHNVDVTKLEEALSPKTKAVMLAHTLGNPFDLQTVRGFCDKHNLWLIEDNCDALGSRYKFNGQWQHTGSIGHIGTSSFYPPHHMTMGEGGAVYTNDPKLKKIAESFRDWGRDCWCASGKDDTCGKRFKWQLGELPEGYDHKYIYSHFGYNLKVTDMQAAVGVAQLKKLPSFTAARKKNWAYLKEQLLDLQDFFHLPQATENSDPSWFGFILTLRDGIKFTRQEIVKHLEQQNIQTRMLFAGNYLRHPAFDQIRNTDAYRVVGDLTNTDKAMNYSFWLGVYPGMKPEMLEFTVKSIREFCKR
jgi:CDP-6-deoxy-D-xylo-4-hexulose-3-dehydrase